MKQRISVRAIIKDNQKILLVRRKGGRPSIQGMYELPGGRIHAGQQPEDALGAALRVHVGLTVETSRLRDVVTFIDPDDGQIQYLFIVYEVAVASAKGAIHLSEEYDKFHWVNQEEMRTIAITKSTELLLDSRGVDLNKAKGSNAINDSAEQRIIAYSDGGARGNPGPAASGYVLLNSREEVICEGGEYLGIASNNIAEYQALYLGLEKAHELGATTVDFHLDSLLVVNQMRGIYKIKNRELLPIHERIKQLSEAIGHVSYTHVRREYNRQADAVVNRILDAAASNE